jgi:hypothetical protein
MTILFKLDAKGGFTVGDTRTGRTAYAYPSSPNARAARIDPTLVASEMMATENRVWRDARPSYSDNDARRLAALRQSAWGAVG